MGTLGDHVAPTTAVVTEEEPVAACAHLLVALARRHLVVTDEVGRPTGLVTDLDVFRQGALTGDGTWVSRPGAARTAGELTIPIDVVGFDLDPLDRALDRLASSIQDVMVCVDAVGCLVGVLGEHDVVAMAAERLPADARAAEVATREVTTVRATEPASAALARMLFEGRRHVVVVDGAGRVEGVISLRDLFSSGVADGERRTCAEVSGPGPARLLGPRASLRRAATVMARRGIGCLPIVDEHRHPIQVLTRTDVIRAFAASLRDHVAVRARPENAA